MNPQSCSKSGAGTALMSVMLAAVGFLMWTACKPSGPQGGRTAAGKVDDAFLRAVAAMPAEQQVLAVMTKLKELNPGLDPATAGETHQTENGVVTELSFSSEGITDISPVRALAKLQSLDCGGAGEQPSPLGDLSPLKGLPLATLNCWNTKVSDLSPLKGMPLEYLDCTGTLVRDLTPLQGMPLSDVNCANTQVEDLSPLKGMRLTHLDCSGTRVADLSPLVGMPLTDLACDNTRVADLRPLKELPLKVLICDFQPERDTAILRAIKTLETINDQPAAEFLKKADAGSGRKAGN